MSNSALVIFAVSLAIAYGFVKEEPCWGLGGNCLSSSCPGGSRLSGKCPSQRSSIRCCVPRNESPCQSQGGTCQFTNRACSSGVFKSGLCPTQASDVRCCVRSSGGGSSTTTTSSLATFDQFKAAVKGCGFRRVPTTANYNSAVGQVSKGSISTKREFAMFLAQIIHESAGLQFKSELACRNNACVGKYKQASCDIRGKYYYGRGYIQLTWCSNYKAASKDLYGDDRLVRDPDSVATNEDRAWATAFWFWKKNVHTRQSVRNGQFGSSTYAINSGECRYSRYHPRANKRFECYKKVFSALGVSGTPNPAGCY